MKDSILKRARRRRSSSVRICHLLEEVCSHVLFLKNGRKIIDGTLAEIRQKYADQIGDASLEEVFFHATGEGKTPAKESPVAPPIITPMT